MICPWKFLDPSATESVMAGASTAKSFAQAVAASDELEFNQLPPKVIKGDSISVRITQEEYEAGVEDCKCNLHGRLTLNKGDTPTSTRVLREKLNLAWKDIRNWTVVPLGKGFFEFKFNSLEDMRRVWAMGVMNLKPGLLRFFGWTKDFKPQHQIQSHSQIWVRFMNLPQEYWRKRTLTDIGSGIGTPITIDDATLSRVFGQFARVLVDVDLSAKLFHSVLVERENHAFTVDVVYEKQPLFCTHCKYIGHSIQQCNRISSTLDKEEIGKNKKIVEQNVMTDRPKNTFQSGKASGTMINDISAGISITTSETTISALAGIPIINSENISALAGTTLQEQIEGHTDNEDDVEHLSVPNPITKQVSPMVNATYEAAVSNGNKHKKKIKEAKSQTEET